jgi:hypothetical protein
VSLRTATRVAGAVLALSCARAAFACEIAVPLEQTMTTLESCDPKVKGCRQAAELLYAYAEYKDEDATRFSVAIAGNPWRLYDGDYRILTVEELAGMIRSHPEFGAAKTVELRASWSGVRPKGSTSTLSERLSQALGGFPVEGSDGFLWAGPKDHSRSSRQAFTAYPNVYYVREGDEVMVSAAAAIAPAFGEYLIKKDPALGYRRVGASTDIFLLCPDKALEAYESAAAHGDAIGAYNAALMRLELNGLGDREAAIALLKKAAARGDAKSADQLRKVKAAK